MAQIARIHQDTIVDNLTAHAADVSDELNSLVNESNGQDSRLTAIEGGSLTSGYVLVGDKNNFLYHAANITGSSTGSSVFTTQQNHGITNGDIIKYALGSDGVLDAGLSVTAKYYGRALTLTTFSFHNTYADAVAGTNAIITTAQGSGTRYLIAGAKLYREGDLFIDGLGAHYALNGNLMDILSVNNFDLRTIRSLAAPLYLSPTTFSMARISERESGNKLSILKSTPTTVNIATVGLNGIAQSGNLNGTASISAGSTGVSFSTSQTGVLQAGDVLTTAGGQARKLLSVAGNGLSAVAESQFVNSEAAVSFKRGGRPSFYTANTVGLVGTSFLYLYAITDGTTPGLILSTRNVAVGDTLVDLPNGYLYSKILPIAFILYNITTAAGQYVGNILPFLVGAGWPYRPKIRLLTQMSGNYGGTFALGTSSVLPHGSATNYTAIDLSLFVPPIAKLVDLACVLNGTYTALRPTGGSDAVAIGANTFVHQILPDMPVGTGQSIDYKNNSNGGDVSLDVYGFTVTELA